MSTSARHNGQNPTDPHTFLILVLGIVYAAGQLTSQQAQALIAAGGIAELVLYFSRLIYGRR